MPTAYAHFIGVGGAGMSGIALVLHGRGETVTGSDLKDSRYSRALSAAGVPVTIGHDAANLGDPEIVVVSSAIPERNPELMLARERGLDVWPRARMLAHLAEDRDTVAVAGTHGKTTTSSMIATMLDRMGLDPTFLIGGEVDGYDTNARNGSGRHYVVEADESDGSFVYLRPAVSLVTNIEADHLDHYASMAEIEETFAEFLSRTREDGAVVVCGDDAVALEVANRSRRRIISYGSSEGCDVRYVIGDRDGTGYRFDCLLPDGTSVASATSIPGVHMVSNATAAIAVAWALGLDVAGAAEALARFTGVRRRFDRIGDVGGVSVVDDYAHHPTEVAATLEATRELGYRRVWALFQPHRYSRTEALAPEFGQAFRAADRVVMMDVYSAGETPVPGVSGKTLVDAILADDGRAQIAYLPHRVDVVPYLVSKIAEGDIVLTMGAGDVTSIGPDLVASLMNGVGVESPCR